MNRPDLGLTFTKIRCWLLDQFEKCVFLDADTLVLQNIDELFEREELSAAPDAGWPDCFNSGVFVLRPCKETYEKLVAFALQYGSFDGGDQGLLNLYFKDWATVDPSKRLPFTYNVVSQAFYSYLPAFMWFRKDIKVVHFIGAVKPWLHVYDRSTHRVQMQSDPGHNAAYLQMWWDIFMEDVEPKLAPQTPSREAAAKLVSGASYTPGTGVEDSERQYSWEEGQIDYLGRDAFTNIKDQLDHSLGKESGKEEAHSHKKEQAKEKDHSPEKEGKKEKHHSPGKEEKKEKECHPVQKESSKEKEAQASKEKEAQASKGKEAQASMGKEAQASKGKEAQASKGKEAPSLGKAPKK